MATQYDICRMDRIDSYKSLHRVIMQGFVEGERRHRRPRMNWISNIIEWTKGDLLENTLDREKWKKHVYLPRFKSPLRPTGHGIKLS